MINLVESLVNVQAKVMLPSPEVAPQPKAKTVSNDARIKAVKKIIEAAPRNIIKHPERNDAQKIDHITEDKSKSETKGWLSQEDSAKCIDGVHLEMFDFFNIELNHLKPGTLNRLQFVMGWGKNKTNSINDAMRRLNKLSIKFGNSTTGETKLDNIYNWLRLNGNA